MTYAPLWRRIFAYAIDVMIAYGIVLVVFQSFIFPLAFMMVGEFYLSGPLIEIYTLLTISLPVWLYFAFLESRKRGASLGKRLLSIKVNTEDGQTLRFNQALTRIVIKLLPWEIAHMAINLPVNAWINPQTGTIDPATATLGPFRSGFLLSVYILALWYLFLAWRSEKNQSLHDRVMNTVVLLDEP